MSVSSVVEPFEPGSPGPLRLGAECGRPNSVVDVLFPLVDDEEWPPYPAEVVDAELIAHDLAEIRGVPWFVNGISRGDIVQVGHDGIGYVGGVVVSRGGHGTIHVMATTEAELAPIATQLEDLGGNTAIGLVPPMLAVDVPENCSLGDVLAALAAAESLTCAYHVASWPHGSSPQLS